MEVGRGRVVAVGSAMGLAGDAVGLGQGGSVGMRMELAWVRLAWVWFAWAGVGVGREWLE